VVGEDKSREKIEIGLKQLYSCVFNWALWANGLDLIYRDGCVTMTASVNIFYEAVVVTASVNKK